MNKTKFMFAVISILIIVIALTSCSTSSVNTTAANTLTSSTSTNSNMTSSINNISDATSSNITISSVQSPSVTSSKSKIAKPKTGTSSTAPVKEEAVQNTSKTKQVTSSATTTSSAIQRNAFISSAAPLATVNGSSQKTQTDFAQYAAAASSTLATNSYTANRKTTLVQNGYYIATTNDNLTVYTANNSIAFLQDTKEFFTDTQGLPVTNTHYINYYDPATKTLYTASGTATQTFSSAAGAINIPSELTNIDPKNISTSKIVSSNLTYYTFTITPSLYQSFLPGIINSLVGNNISVDVNNTIIQLFTVDAVVDSNGYVASETTTIQFTNDGNVSQYKNTVAFTNVGSQPIPASPDWLSSVKK